ncbi:hypothetical protein [Agrobacterium tumefaciens]|uniref:hypothetical protein n=1 Tax=Agrobacterium tumefaciens TaxID=358 RepID=UPI0021CED43F|nr:hypothetical protein [Agrobacterium tumefaciens]UXS03901.1 hypothetical protein FY156_20455 [Agrobacterium tumefaciens]
MEQVNNQAGKRRRKALWAAVAVVAIATAGVVGAKTIYEGKVSEFVALNGGKADAVTVDFLGRVHLRNLTLPLADGTSIRIAAVDGRQKLLFLKSELELNGVDISMPTSNVSMPNVRIEELNVDNALLNGANEHDVALSAAERMESFTAKRVSIPEVTVTQSVANTSQKTVYKNVVLADIVKGKIAQYSADNANFDIVMTIPESDTTGKTNLAVTTGAVSGQDFDAGFMTRLYTEKAGADDKEPKLLYGPLSVKAIVVSDGNSKFSYDEMRSKGLSLRMRSEPLLDTLQSLTKTTKPEELSPQERQEFFSRVMSLFDMIGQNDIEFLGFKADAPESASEEAGKRIKLSIDNISFQLDSRKLNMAMNGMSVGSGDDTIEIAEASLNGFNWSSTLEGLYKLAGLNAQEIQNFPFNELIPELGTIRVSGINADVANPQQDSSAEQEETSVAAPERIRFTLKNYEMALTKPHNGIPSDIVIKQEDLSLPIPEDTTDEAFVQLRKLGLETLTLSYALSASWDEANKNLVIREISLDGKDIGSVNFSGLVSGFTEEFFSLDTNRIQAALFGLAGREAKLTVKDEGLIAKGIKLFAAENGMTEEQARGALTMVATIGLQQAASERPNLQGVTEAVLRFIGTPGTLNMTARAKGPNGLGVFDLVAASQDPMVLLDKVEIEATAN